MQIKDIPQVEKTLDNFAFSGVLNVEGIKRAVVDLSGLPPLYYDKPPSEIGEFTAEAEFLRYLYLPSRKFYLNYKGKREAYQWASGSYYTDSRILGPCLNKECEVMIITPQMYPRYTTVTRDGLRDDLTPFTMGIYENFRTVANEVGFKKTTDWYLTSLIKFRNPQPDVQIPAAWINGCYPWLLQEIYLLKPKYIICAGSQVAKKFFGASATIKKYIGRLLDKEFVFPLPEPSIHTAKVIVLPSVGNVLDPDVMPLWNRQLSLIMDDKKGIYKESSPNYDPPVYNHVAVYSASALQKEIDRIKEEAKTDPKRRIIAVDLEWEGEYPEQEGAHVLTVQFSSKPGEATVVCLTDDKGVVFKDGIETAVKQLETLFTEQPDWKPRLGGHFLRADMPWLLSLGISPEGLRKAYQPANTPEECRDEGGWDTGLMYHAYKEDEEVKDGYGLKILSLKECDVKRYDVDLLQAYEDYSKREPEKEYWTSRIERIKSLHLRLRNKYGRSIKLRKYYKPLLDILKESMANAKVQLKEARHKRVPKGFGCIPYPILKKYAAWDADATRQLAELCIYGMEVRGSWRNALLDDDGYGNSCWEAFWRAHRASWGFGEMERTGFVLDVGRLTELSTTLVHAYYAMLEAFREKINWPDFNPNSTDQRRGLLFGPNFAKKKDGTSVIPEGAKHFDLDPIRATDSTLWEEIGDDELDDYSASTDSLSVSILAQENDDARMFYDICKLGRTLEGNIRPPITAIDKNGEEYLTWDKGIYKYLRPDGRVHTHLSQTKKTGRASSFDPPMQNIGKSAEAILQATLGYRDKDGTVTANYPDLFEEPLYLYPCRTILRAAPGNVLIESDFTGAELAVMAWASGDPNMINHVKLNALPEDDPNYYDIHSHIAVKAFQLDCEPTKKGLASIHKKHLRVAAKAVVFGIPYGRSVDSILLQCLAQGVKLTHDAGQALIESYFDLYPGTRAFLKQCKQNAEKIHYVKTLFNRYRRFSPFLKDAALAKAKREACNAPIQGTVADSINNAIYNLIEYRAVHPEVPFTINMQIHDALVFETPVHCVKSLKEIIRKCMVEENPVITSDNQKHYYGIDSECYVHWGEELTDEIANSEFGLSLDQIL